MKYLHITCGDTLSFCFFLCGGEGEFSGQGFFFGGGRVGRAVCFLRLGWWAGVVALPLHLYLYLSLARWRRQILLSFPLCKTFVPDFLSSWNPRDQMKWVIKSVLHHYMTGDCKLLSVFVAEVSAALLKECKCYVITCSRSRSPPRSRLLKYNAVVENLCRSITMAVHWIFSEVLFWFFWPRSFFC